MLKIVLHIATVPFNMCPEGDSMSNGTVAWQVWGNPARPIFFRAWPKTDRAESGFQFDKSNSLIDRLKGGVFLHFLTISGDRGTIINI